MFRPKRSDLPLDDQWLYQGRGHICWKN